MTRDTEEHKETLPHHNISQKPDMTKCWNLTCFMGDDQNNKHADHTDGNFTQFTFQARNILYTLCRNNKNNSFNKTDGCYQNCHLQHTAVAEFIIKM
jgi:hypothetical protein